MDTFSGDLLGPVNLRSLQLRGMGSYELLVDAAEGNTVRTAVPLVRT